MRSVLVWLALALRLALPLPMGAQQLTFARQAVVGRRAPIELWAVSGTTAAASRPPTSAIIYALAMRHGVSFLDETVAQSRLTAKERRSIPARLFTWGSYFEVGATELVNLHVIQANNQISMGLNIAMGIVNSLLPIVQKDIPVPDPAVLAKVRTGSLLMDAQGSVSGLFWAERSETPGFLETLP